MPMSNLSQLFKNNFLVQRRREKGKLARVGREQVTVSSRCLDRKTDKLISVNIDSKDGEMGKGSGVGKDVTRVAS